MFILTIEQVPGYKIQALGLVRGSVVQSKNIGRDLAAGMKSLAGGEIRGYTEMLEEAREMATKRMIAQGEALGADGIVGLRYSSAAISQGMAEIVAYGTAVKLLQE